MVAEELTLSLDIAFLLFLIGVSVDWMCDKELRHYWFKFLNSLYKQVNRSALSKGLGGHQPFDQNRSVH